ncbi:MAG: hypothetical protein RJA44_2233, partial [Pseudomonadota bacterium]
IVRRLRPADLGPAEQQAWSQLEGRAADANAYLSPHFVLPALQYLDPGLQALIVVVQERRSGVWHGLGVFTAARASRLCPLPQLTGYLSRHSYLGGLLVDRDAVDAVIAALLADLGGWSGWPLLVLPKMPSEGAVAQALQRHAARSGLAPQLLGRQERAMLLPSATGPELLRQLLGKRFNEVERCKRRLGEQGAVSWQCLRARVDATAVENFLQLEHQGWKAEEGSSLRSNPADEAFFKAMVAAFDSEGRALFTELRVGERAVASTSNVVSGGTGFAFKVGWEAELRKFGPGLINEVEFMRVAPQVCADLASFDSGAAPDSFINRLWTERRELATLVVPLNRLGAWGVDATAALRQGLRRLRRPAPAPVGDNAEVAAPAES